VSGGSRRWRAWITETAQAELHDAATKAHPSETGGVLIGVLADGRRPWITNAVELPSAKSSGTFYEVPAGARRRAVKRLRRHDPRLGYLGEWHAHPADIPPSAIDAATLGQLAADPDAGCERPVLLIARRTSGGYMLDGRQLSRKRLRPLEMLASGPVPEARATSRLPPSASSPRRSGRRFYLGAR